MFVIAPPLQYTPENLPGKRGAGEGFATWDGYGVSWQIVPTVPGDRVADPNRARAKRVMEAMLKMVKLEIAQLTKAREGV